MSQTELDVRSLMVELGEEARKAASALALLKPSRKNEALLLMAKALRQQSDSLKSANEKDLLAGEQKGLTSAMLDRLRHTDGRILAMATALEEIAALPDPVAEMTNFQTRPNGIQVGQMRMPLGVIGIIYESRPNVTAEAAGLCLKSGNAVILRGGSEAFHSNQAIAELLRGALKEAEIPPGAIQLVSTTDRAAVSEMLQADKYIDLIIPRGGRSLIERVHAESRIPVIKHLDGVCHVYVDEGANLEMALAIIENAKVQRPGVCNAAENLLVHRLEAAEFLPKMAERLRGLGVELRGCEETLKIVPDLAPCEEEDWSTEYLSLILAVKVVEDFEEAVAFINHYGSHHTEAIVTKDHGRAMRFLRAVDSACVHINCSTRFSDGGQYGLGAEIGISTDKLHARGPMGLRELTTLKWIVFGEGQIRE